jgi:hypothetical protein
MNNKNAIQKLQQLHKLLQDKKIDWKKFKEMRKKNSEIIM